MRKEPCWRCFLAPCLCVWLFLGRGRGGRSKKAQNSGMENISSGQAPKTADPRRAALVCCYFAEAGTFCVERGRDGRWKKWLIHAPGGSSWRKQKDFRKTWPMVWAFIVFWEVQSSGILEAVPLEMCVFEEFPAEQRSPPCRGDSACVCRLGHTRISAGSSKHCLTQGMCWAGVCSRPTLIHPLFCGSSRSCDPDEFTRELSRLFSFPFCGSYTFAHPNPVLCTMMQTLIINQIIQPAFSNSCLIQSFLSSLLFDVCFHILFIAYNSSAAVNTELLIVMDFCYTYHYSVWILFNHHKCIFIILQRFSSHYTD